MSARIKGEPPASAQRRRSEASRSWTLLREHPRWDLAGPEGAWPRIDSKDGALSTGLEGVQRALEALYEGRLPSSLVPQAGDLLQRRLAEGRNAEPLGEYLLRIFNDKGLDPQALRCAHNAFLELAESLRRHVDERANEARHEEGAYDVRIGLILRGAQELAQDVGKAIASSHPQVSLQSLKPPVFADSCVVPSERTAADRGRDYLRYALEYEANLPPEQRTPIGQKTYAYIVKVLSGSK